MFKNCGSFIAVAGIIIGILLVIIFILLGRGYHFTYSVGFNGNNPNINKILQVYTELYNNNRLNYNNLKKELPYLDNTHYYELIKYNPDKLTPDIISNIFL